uniref:Uncharacterized protein n=1 Tax=Rheinheimera sp. BAL341 TaxID=1708203 RepID=A0A486XJC6_9GAMM
MAPIQLNLQLIAAPATEQDKVYYKKSQHKLASLTLNEQFL